MDGNSILETMGVILRVVIIVATAFLFPAPFQVC